MFATRPLLETLYKAKTRWPPNVSQMSANKAFLLEKKYKRRGKLKYTNERWIKGVKMAQFGLISAFIVWTVLFYEWDRPADDPPFKEIRKWVFEGAAGIWSSGNVKRREVLKKEYRDENTESSDSE